MTKLSPGWVTLQWEESITHLGSPFRIALSEENCESPACFDTCILLNHIPHDDSSAPCGNPPCTPYTQYRVTVLIPDVYCNQCILQLVMVDTAKIKPGDTCTYPSGYSGRHFITGVNDSELIGQYSSTLGAYYNDRRGFDGKPYTGCPSVYHSCANVFIDGQQPRQGLQCEQPVDWPYRDLPFGFYGTSESAPWTPDRYLYSPTPRSYNQRNVTYGIFDNASNALVTGPYATGVRATFYASVSDAPNATAPNANEDSVAYEVPEGYLALENAGLVGTSPTLASPPPPVASATARKTAHMGVRRLHNRLRRVKGLALTEHAASQQE